MGENQPSGEVSHGTIPFWLLLNCAFRPNKCTYFRMLEAFKYPYKTLILSKKVIFQVKCTENTLITSS